MCATAGFEARTGPLLGLGAILPVVDVDLGGYLAQLLRKRSAHKSQIEEGKIERLLFAFCLHFSIFSSLKSQRDLSLVIYALGPGCLGHWGCNVN